jgi:hypothetical protein
LVARGRGRRSKHKITNWHGAAVAPTIMGRLAATVLPLTVMVPSRCGGMHAMCTSVQANKMAVSAQ